MAYDINNYARRAFEFFERINRLSASDEISEAIIQELKTYGYEYLTIWTVPPPGCPLQGIMLNTRPEDYVARYIEKNYVLKDPIVTYLRRTRRPYSWSDVRSNMALSKSEERIINEAREFDVHDGFIVPIITATGTLSLVSACGRDPDLSERARSAVELIGMIAHQALKRAKDDPPNSEATIPLTPREREIMQMIAFGKTDSEIATILNLSEATVYKHVQNAKAKLGAARRTFALTLALQRGEVLF